MPYASETPLAQYDPAHSAAELRRILASRTPALKALTESDAATVVTTHWSRKQVLGHLIDSAGNNLQRFVRLQLQPSLELPGYEPDGWVRVQHFTQRSWTDLIALWSALNEHLAHVIQNVDRAALGRIWQHEGHPWTLAFIIEDYIGHIEYHMRQIFQEPAH